MQTAKCGAVNFAPIELKENETANPADIVTKALDDFKGTVDDRLKDVETKATERLDQIEARLNRPVNDNVNKKDAENGNEAETKNFGIYLRHADKSTDLDRKTLRVSSDPQGGYFAPSEFSTEFIRDLIEFSPIRSIASVRKTNHESVTLGKRTGITNALWKGELEASEESEPAFGELEIVTKGMTTHVDISNQLLQDAAGDVEDEVRLALSEDFGQKESAAFVNGDGVLQPKGCMFHADVAETVNGHATVLAADALITLIYAQPATYRNRGVWLMNGSTLATIRKLKDGQGNYLWQPAYAAGQPETILGKPVYEAVDMADIEADAYPIIFGDFSGYRIVDRVELSVLVNPYLLATNGMTRFHATRRTGGDVIQPAKLRKLKMST